MLNGKIYIGAHSSEILDQRYLGSGIQLKSAIKKYGIENFRKEILEFFENREDAFKQESEVVTEEFIKEDTNYNMMPGGLGGAVRTKEWKEKVSSKLKGRVFSEEHSRKKSLAQTGEKNHRYGKPNPNNPKMYGKDNAMFGKKHSEETKKAISENRKLTKVDYTPDLIHALLMACKGKFWYNNGKVAKRFHTGTQPAGFERGRKIRNDKEL